MILVVNYIHKSGLYGCQYVSDLKKHDPNIHEILLNHKQLGVRLVYNKLQGFVYTEGNLIELQASDEDKNYTPVILAGQVKLEDLNLFNKMSV